MSARTMKAATMPSTKRASGMFGMNRVKPRQDLQTLLNAATAMALLAYAAAPAAAERCEDDDCVR